MGDGRREGDDMASMAWPGFVDILSAVIIMFVFFVLITATALFFHTITYKDKLKQEALDEAEKVEITREAQVQARETLVTIDLKKVIETQQQQMVIMQDEIKKLEVDKITVSEENKLKQYEANFSESENQTLEIRDNGATVVVYFGRDSISLTEEIKIQLDAHFKTLTGKINSEKIQLAISSGKSPTAPTESSARSLAVARMLNTRNAFIDNNLLKNKISIKILEAEEIGGHYDWVKLEFNENE